MGPRMVCLVLVLGVSFTLSPPLSGEAAAEARGPLDERALTALVEVAPSEEEKPEEDALILFEGTYVEYRDGKATVRRQRLTKLYTEWSLDHLGDPRLAYDRNRQELEVHASRTYLPDGSTMDTPDNGYNEVTPFGVDLSVDHLDFREMVVTHVGLERGMSILLDWTIRDTEACELPFQRLFFLDDELPVREGELVVEGDLRGETVNPPDGLYRLPDPEKRPGKLVWRFKDLPRRPHGAERLLGDQLPWVAISELGTWEELTQRFAARTWASARETGMLDSALAGLEEETPFVGEHEAIEGLAEMVEDRTTLLRYDPWVFTPLPRSVGTVLSRSVATPQERCALLLAGYRLLGFSTELILPAAWKTLSREAPVLQALADPLLRVRTKSGETWWVDPSDGSVTSLSPVPGGVPCFVFETGEGRETAAKKDVAPVRTSRVEQSVFWDLASGEAKCEGILSGPLTEDLSMEQPEELLREWVESWSDSAEVSDLRILSSVPGGIHFALSATAPLPEPNDRGRVVLDLPLPPADLEGLRPPGMEPVRSRSEAVLFPAGPVEIHLDWQVRLPEDRPLLEGPEKELAWEGAAFAVERTESESGLEIDYRFHWDGRPVPPEAYAGFRHFWAEVLNPRYTRIVLGSETEEEPED